MPYLLLRRLSRAALLLAVGLTALWASGAPAGAQQVRRPAPPVVTLEAGDKRIFVHWDEPDTRGTPIDHYDVAWTTGGFWNDAPNKEVGADVRSYEITGLTNGTTYQVEVSATNTANLHSDSSATVEATPGVTTPYAPKDLSVTAASVTSLKLTWTAPFDGDSDITGYDVEWQTPAGGDWSSASSAEPGKDATSHTITGLTEDSEYGVRVRAVNAQGDGAWATASATPEDSPPDAPGGLSVSVAGGTSLELTWTAPHDGFSAITGYDVEWQTPAGGDWSSAGSATATASAVSHTITGLTQGSEYDVRVRAVNAVGDGAWAATTGTPVVAPAAPVVTVERRDNSINISYSTPDDGGSAITGWFMQWSIKSDFSSTADYTAQAFQTSVRQVALGGGNGVLHYVRVRAINSVGDSDWSEVVTMVPSAAPATVPGKVDSSTISIATELGQAKLSWSAPGNGGHTITDYDVQYRLSTASSWTEHAPSVTSRATTATITGLQGQEYSFRVRAQNPQGDGAWSDAVAREIRLGALSVPSPPTAMALSAKLAPFGNVEKFAVTATWEEPADDGGSAATAYRGQLAWTERPLDQVGWSVWDVFSGGADARSYTQENITKGARGYNVWLRMAARNAAGWGAWSDGVGMVLPDSPTPDAPTLTPGRQRIDVSWTAPPSDEDFPIEGYRIIHREKSAGSWSSHSVDKDATRHTITGLLGGVTYEVQMLSTTALGDSASSETVEATVLAGPPDAPTLTLSGEASGKVSAFWEAPGHDGGSPVTGYELWWQTPSGGDWSSVGAASAGPRARSHVITGLGNGDAYDVRVRALNFYGPGEWSPVRTATPLNVPDAPAAPALTTSGTQIVASWTAPTNDTGSAITDYDVRHRNVSDGGAWTEADDTGSNATDTSTTATITGLTAGKRYEVQVRVGNANGDSGWSRSSAIAAGNSAPVMTDRDGNAVSAVSQTIAENTSLTGAFKATDADGDAVQWSLERVGEAPYPEGITTSETTDGVFEFTVAQGVLDYDRHTGYQWRVVATDAKGDRDTLTYDITVTDVDEPPATPAPPTVQAVSETALGVSWSDPGGQSGQSPPPTDGYQMRLRRVGSTNWDVTPKQDILRAYIPFLARDTNYEAQVRASNAEGDSSWSASGTGATTSASGDTTPFISTTPADRTFHEGRAVGAVTLPDATGGDGTLSYSVLPDLGGIGLTWQAPSRTITGAPGRAQPATTYTYTATDADGDTASVNFKITVLPNQAPRFGAAQAQFQVKESLAAGAAVGDPLTATDPDGDALSFALHGAGAQDFSIDASGQITVAAGLDYETRSSYSLTAEADDQRSRTGVGTMTVSITVEDVEEPPSAPAAPIVGGESETSLLIFWQPPRNTGPPLTGYSVRHRPSGGASWTQVDNLTATQTTVEGLAADVIYEAQVQAHNAEGSSGWSATGTGTTVVDPPGDMDRPALTVGDGRITVSWTAPGGYPGYELVWRLAGFPWNGAAGGAHTAGAADTSHTITGLVGGGTYQVRIRAVNSAGSSPWVQAFATLPAARPTPEAPAAPAAPSLTVNDRSSRITISWNAPADGGSPIWRYLMRVGERGSPIRYSVALDAPDANSQPPTSSFFPWGSGFTLAAGKTYEATVQAVNYVGPGDWSPPGSVTVPDPGPPPPAAPHAPGSPQLAVTPASITVNWHKPHDGTAAVTGYRVQWSTLADFSSASGQEVGAAARSHTISGLTTGTRYYVRVRAMNSVGDGPYSAAASEVPSGPPTPPGAPALTQNGDSIVISWSAPAANGSPISRYHVDLTEQDGSLWRSQETSAPSTTYTFKSGPGAAFEDGATYSVTVRAINGKGASAWSSAATITYSAP